MDQEYWGVRGGVLGKQGRQVWDVFALILQLGIKVMPFFRPVKTKKRSKRYDKVSHKCRVMLLKKVICDQSEIKQSAEQLEINYSTAKTLLRKYKYHGHQINTQVLQGICKWYSIYDVERQRCKYRFIELDSHPVKVQQDSPPSKQLTDPLNQQPEEQIQPQRETATPVEILQQVLFKD